MQTYAPGTRIGQYEIVSAPLMGALSVVYFCLDHGNDERPVALKIFKPEFLPDRAARDRFLREGATWVELGRHTHIVHCYEVKYFDPTAFLVLELIAKEEKMVDASLRAWMNTSIPVAQALLFALQIARGMKHATNKIPGLVHRDLKPEHVLVGADKLPDTSINRVRVTAFGLATIHQEKASRVEDVWEGQAVGTPLYMAPEQWTGSQVGAYTDVYALGCILYELLTGQRAASGRNLKDVQAAHCNGDLRPVPDDLPEPVRAFLKRSLAVAPEKRYQKWDEVTDELAELYTEFEEEPVPPEQGQEDASTEERRSVACSYNEIGTSYAHMGKAQVALNYFEKALDIFREFKDKGGEGAALGKLGNTHDYLGRPQVALDYFEKALHIFRAIGDQHSEVATLNNIGEVYRKTGELHRAVSFYEQNLEIARGYGDRRGEGNAQCSLGLAYASLGELHRAIDCFEQYLEIVHEIGDRRGEGIALGNLGNAYAQLGNPFRAIDNYKQYENIAREIGDRVGEGNALGSLGNIYLAQGNAQSAIDLFYMPRLEVAREIGDRRGEGVTLGNLGNAYAQLGEWQYAIDNYEQRLEIAREISDRLGEGIALSNLGNAYAALGDISKALKYVQGSVDVFKQIGHVPNTQRAQKLLDQLRGGNARNISRSSGSS